MVAEEVCVTLSLDATAGLFVLEASDAPKLPSKSYGPGSIIHQAVRRGGPRVNVERYAQVYEIRAEIGTVQPGTTRWSPETFYVGAQQDLTVTAKVTISANNLRAPIALAADIAINVTSRSIAIGDIA